MDPNGKKENTLTSWKEIAAYLDRDVRTCIRWEQRYGLPVHRLDRDSKAKVFAYKDEVDRWLAGRSAVVDAAAEAQAPVRRSFRFFPILIAMIGLGAAAYFLFVHPKAGAPGVPAGFLIRGSQLVVTNAQGRELWSYDTRLRDLYDDSYYREHYQVRGHNRSTYDPVWPYVMIQDLNKDGRPEVLFTPKTKSEAKEGRLTVFDDKGAELWHFDGGRALTFGRDRYRAVYRVWGFDVDDYDGDGESEILVVSIQKPDFPCQVVLLDAAGKVEGEYWNAGYLFDAELADVDLDGVKELMLGGVNNEYARGCLAVFKPGRLHGSSPQIANRYRSPELAAGQQSLYILFPTSDVHAARHAEGDPVNYFWAHEEGGFQAVTTSSHLIYEFDASLRCSYVILATDFQNLHRELTWSGLVHTELDDAYKQDLLGQFRYFFDGRWSPSTPASVGR
ncbi:MAG TPA: VCBS repeat-containing protein [Candidatus Bathyarchaeia archaeon]|nr:VCBS repeat-containing protein [Candidatus Bathyarchaeia archaeon]